MSISPVLTTVAMGSSGSRRIVSNEAPRARAVRTLRAWIAEGRLVAGDPLPPERQLSKMMGVGMSTLQRALRLIEAEGSIQSVSGKTRIVSRGDTVADASIANAIVVIGSTEYQPGHLQPGWADFTPLGVIQGLRQAGDVFICLSSEEAIKRFAAPLANVKPKALVVIQEPEHWRLLHAELQKLQEQQIPIVLFNNNDEPSEFDDVSSDQFAGAYQLTQWLLTRGARRILNFWPEQPMLGWMRQRFAGYEAAMREAGVPPIPIQFYTTGPAQSVCEKEFDTDARRIAGYLGPLLISAEPPDAIMCISDGPVAKIVKAASFFGRQANRDLAIVGYDCYWLDAPERQWANSRPLATIDKQNFIIGLELAALLHARLTGELTGPAQHRKIQPKLVVLPEDAELSSPIV